MYRGTTQRLVLLCLALLFPFPFIAGCLVESSAGDEGDVEGEGLAPQLRDVGGDAASAPEATASPVDAASVPEATAPPMDTGSEPVDGAPPPPPDVSVGQDARLGCPLGLDECEARCVDLASDPIN